MISSRSNSHIKRWFPSIIFGIWREPSPLNLPIVSIADVAAQVVSPLEMRMMWGAGVTLITAPFPDSFSNSHGNMRCCSFLSSLNYTFVLAICKNPTSFAKTTHFLLCVCTILVLLPEKGCDLKRHKKVVPWCHNAVPVSWRRLQVHERL